MPSRVLSPEEIARYAYAAGFRGEALLLAVAIAFPESGGNMYAHNPNRSTGDNSYGLMQINMIDSLGPERRRQFGISSNEELWDPLVNMKAAFMVSGGGKNFSPWTTFKKGAHQAHLAKARQAVESLGVDIGELPAIEAGGAPSGASVSLLPSDDDIKALFRDLLGRDPDEDELSRYTGKSTKQAKQMMLATEEGLEMTVLGGIQRLRGELV